MNVPQGRPTSNQCANSELKKSRIRVRVAQLEADGRMGVDPYGTGGTRPPNIWTGGHYHECPPQYF